MKTYKVHLTLGQIGVITSALEAYARAQAGQFGIWYEEVFLSTEGDPYFEKNIGDNPTLKHEHKKVIQTLLKALIFKDSDSSKSIGVTGISTKGKMGLEISDALTQFKSVTENGGWFEQKVAYDDPRKLTDTEDPIPKIEGFKNYCYVLLENPSLIYELSISEGQEAVLEEAARQLSDITYEKLEVFVSAEGNYFAKVTRPAKKT